MTTVAADPQQDPWARRAMAHGEVVLEEETGVAYRVVDFIGRGGMGEVYVVERVHDGYRMALKCMRLSNAADATLLKRARQEAIVLQAVTDRHLVRVYSMGVRADGVVWMIMQLLTGWTVGQLLKEEGRLPLPWALEIVRDACIGLHAVHKFATHRDVKPDNIHLDVEGVVRVLDLGAAKANGWSLLTTGNFSLGTVAYMSPEQLQRPQTVDHRSDIFSAGVVLYQLLTGRHPFVNAAELEDKRSVGMAIITREAPPASRFAPWTPPYMDEAVARALARNPEDRYDDADQLANLLTAALGRLAHDLGCRTAPLRFLARTLWPIEHAADVARPPVPGAEPAATEQLAPLGGQTERLSPLGGGIKGMAPLGGGTEPMRALSDAAGVARAKPLAPAQAEEGDPALAPTEEVASEDFSAEAVQAQLEREAARAPREEAVIERAERQAARVREDLEAARAFAEREAARAFAAREGGRRSPIQVVEVTGAEGARVVRHNQKPSGGVTWPSWGSKRVVLGFAIWWALCLAGAVLSDSCVRSVPFGANVAPPGPASSLPRAPPGPPAPEVLE